MRVLLIKTSSMGDIIHTLPALTDAGLAIPNIRFDWVVEDAFVEIPKWHPLVRKIIPVALRRWRKVLFSKRTREEWWLLLKRLEYQYDLVLDAQGLIKSAFLTLFAKGKRAGLDWQSARESFASLAYQHKYSVNFKQHAVVRMRQLFSKSLGYDLPSTPPKFEIKVDRLRKKIIEKPYVVFLHGTSWQTKLWPENYWASLAKFIHSKGFAIKMNAADEFECERVHRIAKLCDCIEITTDLKINNVATMIANASAAIAVDTGFGHLSAAMNVPTISLYGPTNPEYTGALGDQSWHLKADFDCAPCLNRICTYKKESDITPACFKTIPPSEVFRLFESIIK